MDAKKCDRCGKFYTKKEQDSMIKDAFDQGVMVDISTREYESTGTGSYKNMDFCPECKGKLLELIRGFLKIPNSTSF